MTDGILKRTHSTFVICVFANIIFRVHQNHFVQNQLDPINMNFAKSARRTFLKTVTASAAGFVAVPSLAAASATKVVSEASHSNRSVQASYFRKSFGDLWERIAKCTIEFANAMPEEHYNFNPVPEVRTFKEQMLHISNSDFWIENYLSADKVTGDNYETEGKSKADCVKLMEDSFENMSTIIAEITDDELHTVVETFAGPLTRMEVLYFMRDHITHHRASTVPYLRLNGVVPPAYIGS